VRRSTYYQQPDNHPHQQGTNPCTHHIRTHVGPYGYTHNHTHDDGNSNTLRANVGAYHPGANHTRTNHICTDTAHIRADHAWPNRPLVLRGARTPM